MIEKLREMRETNVLELDQEEAHPTIGTDIEIPNECLENILITDSDLILSDRTSPICKTADMSFNRRLEADFEKVAKFGVSAQTETGIGGVAALPPSVSQVNGINLCFLVTRVSERNVIDPEHVMLALTRLRNFLVKIGMRFLRSEQGQIEG